MLALPIRHKKCILVDLNDQRLTSYQVRNVIFGATHRFRAAEQELVKEKHDTYLK